MGGGKIKKGQKTTCITRSRDARKFETSHSEVGLTWGIDQQGRWKDVGDGGGNPNQGTIPIKRVDGIESKG